jgi:hypothetical protein
LPLYHQLVTHTSPQKIEILEVQNGSIDLVINLDLKVALSLAGLFKVGFAAFAAYLAHKKQLLPVAAGYFGNKKLLELDKAKEQVLLENVGESVSKTAMEQHQKASTGGAKVDNVSKVIEQVSNLVTLHIVRGNDVKILALPEKAEAELVADSSTTSTPQDLRQAATTARNALNELPPGATQLLLDQYGTFRLEGDEREASPDASVSVKKPPQGSARKKRALDME